MYFNSKTELCKLVGFSLSKLHLLWWHLFHPTQVLNGVEAAFLSDKEKASLRDTALLKFQELEAKYKIDNSYRR